jgi:glycosyltransferase involved in cell wall biosynthesis
MDPFLSIIIPAYNEAQRIGPTLDAVTSYFSKKNMKHEIIVVDDGSKDTTSIVSQKFPKVRVLVNEKNRGKGYSVKRGMAEARGECRLFMDADHSVHIDNLDRFLEELQKGADVAIASIEVPGSTIQDANYRYRRALGRWSKWLIRAVATPGIHDTQRGFKLFTKNAAESLFPPLITDRWGFDIEILRRAQKKGLIIRELPVEWNNSKATSVTLGSYFRTLFELIKIRICV